MKTEERQRLDDEREADEPTAEVTAMAATAVA
jgi:hypothetical protein